MQNTHTHTHTHTHTAREHRVICFWPPEAHSGNWRSADLPSPLYSSGGTAARDFWVSSRSALGSANSGPNSSSNNSFRFGFLRGGVSKDCSRCREDCSRCLCFLRSHARSRRYFQSLSFLTFCVSRMLRLQDVAVSMASSTCQVETGGNLK